MNSKIEIVFHQRPSELGAEQAALMLSAANQLQELADKLGLDFDGAQIAIVFPNKLRASLSLRRVP